MRLWPLFLLILSGCADPAFSTGYVDDVAIPEGQGGPYGGDGFVHAIAVVLSFDVEGETHGNIGAHCGFDDWTTSPATALIYVGNETAPSQTLIRMLTPGQDDEGVAHFGTATYADWRGDHTIDAAFDHKRELGTVTFDPPRFGSMPIPSDSWLEATFRYTVPGDGGPVHVKETLHLRDFGQVPLELDRDTKMCL